MAFARKPNRKLTEEAKKTKEKWISKKSGKSKSCTSKIFQTKDGRTQAESIFLLTAVNTIQWVFTVGGTQKQKYQFHSVAQTMKVEFWWQTFMPNSHTKVSAYTTLVKAAANHICHNMSKRLKYAHSVCSTIPAEGMFCWQLRFAEVHHYPPQWKMTKASLTRMDSRLIRGCE